MTAVAAPLLARSYATTVHPKPRRDSRAELELLRLRYRDVLQALAAAEDRARCAERRLRSRLLELTWPAGVGGPAGGVAGGGPLGLGRLVGTATPPPGAFPPSHPPPPRANHPPPGGGG